MTNALKEHTKFGKTLLFPCEIELNQKCTNYLWLLLHRCSCSSIAFVDLATDPGKGAQDLLLTLHIAEPVIRSYTMYISG